MLLSARTLVVCLLTLLLISNSVSAQQNETQKNESKTSYDVLLQLLIADGNIVQRNELLPAALAPLEKKLKNDFGNFKYRLALTLLNRAADRGFIKIKGVSPFEQNQANDKLLNFYEANLAGIRSTEKGELQIGSLSFAWRVPIAVAAGAPAADGKNFPVINYEQLGITAGSLNIPFNEPTIIGTMTTPRPNENIVLVLTVKPSGSSNLIAKMQ